MRKYSFSALLLFIVSAVFRILGIFFPHTSVYTALFYILFLLGLVLEGVECFSKKEYARVFPDRNDKRLEFFALTAAVGMFIDFVSSAVGVYSCFFSRSDTALRTVLEVLLCLFALLSCIAMALCAVSFSDSGGYDFSKLGAFNSAPFVWLLVKCTIGLTDVFTIKDVDLALMYLAVVFGLGAFYCFAYESQSKAGAKSFCVFCFNSFSACVGICSLGRIFSVARGACAVDDENSFFILSLLLSASFVYSLGRNALKNSAY